MNPESLACPSHRIAGTLLTFRQDARPLNRFLPVEDSRRGDPQRNEEDKAELVEVVL